MLPSGVFVIEARRLTNEALSCPEHMVVKKLTLEAQALLALAMVRITQREELMRNAQG